MFLLRLWRWWITLNWEIPSLPDTLHMLLAGMPLYLGTHPWNLWSLANLTITNCQGFCIPIKNFSTLWLLCYDRLFFHTTYVFICFCGVMVQFEPVKHVSESDICVTFKSHIEWKNMQYVNTLITTILPTTAGTLSMWLKLIWYYDIYTANSYVLK